MNPRFVTIKRFCELTGYTDDAVRSKMKRGEWLEGALFLRAPDNRVLMDMIGYERWVLRGPPDLAEAVQAEQIRTKRCR